MTFLTLHAVHTRTHAYTYIIPPLSSLSLLVSRSHHNLHRHTKTRAAAQNPAPRDEVFKIQHQEREGRIQNRVTQLDGSLSLSLAPMV